MKISKKTLSKWEFDEIKPHSLPKRAESNEKQEGKGEALGTVFGLPKCVLQHNKNNEVRTAFKPKNGLYENYLESYEVQAMQTMRREHYSNIRDVLKNRTKQLFRPIKKHHSVIDTIKVESQEEKVKVKISKKAPISSEHSSQKALSILQKIILKEADFYANKKKANMELHASKLPIIQFKQSKRKQSLAAYESSLSPSNTSALIKYQNLPAKYQSLPSKPQKAPAKKQRQKPYFSGWDVIQPNDF